MIATIGTNWGKPAEAMFRDMLVCLKRGWDIKVIGQVYSGSNAAAIVVNQRSTMKTYWIIADNGGELNVERINDTHTSPPVAYSQGGALTDAATLAYRVRCVVDGEYPDYDTNFSDLLPDLLAMDTDESITEWRSR